MRRAPKVSVVIPSWRGGRWVARCVRSLQNQTFGDFEVIYVDDGSPEEPSALLEAARAEPRVRVIFRRHSGLSVARNTGLEAARGAFVGFLDADDLYHHDCLRHTVGALEAEPRADFVYFNHVRATFPEGSEAPICEKAPTAIQGSEVSTSPFRDFVRAHPHGTGACYWLFRRVALGDLRFLPGLSLAEDGDFIFRFLLRARRGIWLKGTFYYYIRTPGSIVNSPFTAECLAAEDMLLRHLCAAFREHPRELTLLRRTFFLKQIKVTRKALRAIARTQGASGLVALGRAQEVRLFAEGIYSLRGLPLHWKLRLLPSWVRGRWLRLRGAPIASHAPQKGSHPCA